jgi:hypothetical protein
MPNTPGFLFPAKLGNLGATGRFLSAIVSCRRFKRSLATPCCTVSLTVCCAIPASRGDRGATYPYTASPLEHLSWIQSEALPPSFRFGSRIAGWIDVGFSMSGQLFYICSICLFFFLELHAYFCNLGLANVLDDCVHELPWVCPWSSCLRTRHHRTIRT